MDVGKKGYFENLDSLRFFSFLVVFLFHTKFYEWVHSFTSYNIFLWPARLLGSGGWGVTFFFVLSGFLITWLLLKEKQQNGRINIRFFYIRRILRIWPLYYVVFFIGFFLLPFFYRYTGHPLFFDYNGPLYAFFLSNFGLMHLDPAYDAVRSFPLVLNISWSVSIEEQFYLVWPFLFAFIPKRFFGWVLTGVLAAAITAGYFFHSEKVIYYHTMTRMAELSIGGILANITLSGKKMSTTFRNLKLPVIVFIYILPASLILVNFSYTFLPFYSFLIRIIVALFFGFIILEQNFSTHSLFKFGRLRLASYLGKISYGLYMLHPIAMFFTNIIISKKFPQNSITGQALYISGSLLITIGLAFLSYNLMEKKFLRVKTVFSKI
jgi:peptidoglycan/LPS O-acetylase OafA/YrhL